MIIIQALFDLFNWKKYPANVFYIALPLAVLGFICMMHVAILHIKLEHDYIYLYEWFGGMVLLAFGLYHPVRGLCRSR